MPKPKMIPAISDSTGSPQDRFKNFAKAILAVPKSEIAMEQVHQEGEARLAPGRKLSKRKAKTPSGS